MPAIDDRAMDYIAPIGCAVFVVSVAPPVIAKLGWSVFHCIEGVVIAVLTLVAIIALLNVICLSITHDLTDFDDQLEEVAEPVFVREAGGPQY